MTIVFSRLFGATNEAFKAPARGILKKSQTNEDIAGSHTVIGVLQEALKEEKAREEESETDVLRRRELRKSLNRRVSFASHATIRYYTPPNQLQQHRSWH